MKNFLLILMGIMVSLSVFGQVVSINPFEVRDSTPYEPIIITNPTDGKFYIDPCSITWLNTCIFNIHSTCIDDGQGKYHCECSDGYKHVDDEDDKSICVDLCSGACDTYGNGVECTSQLIAGKSICLQKEDFVAEKCINTPESDKCGGVLLCSEEELGGVCKVFTESTNDFNLTWYNNNGIIIDSLPKSAKPINTNWEIYAPKESRFSLGYGLFNLKNSLSTEYSNGNILNFNTSDINKVNVFVIQAINKTIFKAFYTDTTPYISLAYKTTYNQIRYRQVFKSIKAFNTEHFLPSFGINYIEIDDDIRVEAFDENNDYFLFESNLELAYSKYLNTIISSKLGENIDEGLVICGDNLGNYECKAIKRMAYNFRDHDNTKPDTTSTNWIELIDNSSLVYLHEGWEAFICDNAYTDFTNCKPITPEYTYNNFSEIDSNLGAVELLIIQPKTPEKLEEVFGDIPYAILYDEPNFHGNHILIYEENRYKAQKYPNPIKNPKSIYNNKKGLNLYLNKGAIVANATLGTGVLYKISNDKFINTTDSTPWEIEYEDGDKYYTISTYRDENFGIHNEGVKITFNDTDVYGRNYYKTYQGRYYNVGELDNINNIEIYKGWEVYFCSDIEKNNCYRLISPDDADFDYDAFTWISGFFGESTNIKYMLVQPKNHAKMNQFYGHKEHSELGNGLAGYVELYKNKEFIGEREIIFKSSVIGVDTIIKSDQVKAIRVVGGLKVTGKGVLDINGSGYFGYTLNEFNINKNLPNSNNYDIYIDDAIYNIELESLEQIKIYSGHYPSVVTHSNLNANARSLGKYISKYAPDETIKGFYTNTGSYYPIYPNDSHKAHWLEDEEQNKIMDNADLVYYAAHGDWEATYGSTQKVLEGHWNYNQAKPDSNNLYRLKQGSSFGDYETEWMITSACNSLGKLVCNKCEYEDLDGRDIDGNVLVVITGSTVEECADEYPKCIEKSDTTNRCIKCEINDTVYTNDFCGHDVRMYCKGDSDGNYPTPEKEVFNSYKEHFANGLHGFGGMFTLSHWIGSYGDESKEMWHKIMSGYSIAYSWLNSFGWGAWPLRRNAGYIASGPCRRYWSNDEGKEILSYIHNDHFWGYPMGGTLFDPDRTFIKNEGFCYYAYASGNYNHRPYSFSIIKDLGTDWDILNESNQEFAMDSLSSNFANAFKVDIKKIFIGEKLISYSKKDDKNILLMDYDKNNSIWNAKITDDNLIYSLKNNADIFYDNNIKNITESYNYEIQKVDLSLVVDRHYNHEGDAESKVRVNEIIFNYQLSINGNPFLEENYVKIGINPITGEVLSIKVKIIALEKNKEIIEKKQVDFDFDKLINSSDIYYKTYYKEGLQYRPAIYRIHGASIEIIKKY